MAAADHGLATPVAALSFVNSDALAALDGGRLNATSLQSCIAAKVLWAALGKAGPHPTRESLLQAMGGLGRADMGGYALNFPSGNRHGSQWVDLTMLSRGSSFVQ